MELEHEADVPVAEGHERRVVGAGHVDVAHANRAGVGAIEAAEHVQERALAHARRAHDRHHLAEADGDLEIAQHVEPVAGAGVVLLHAARDEERRHSWRRPSAGSSRAACRDG